MILVGLITPELCLVEEGVILSAGDLVSLPLGHSLARVQDGSWGPRCCRTDMRGITAAFPLVDDAWRITNLMPGDELFVPWIPAKDGEPLPSDIDISKRPLGHVTAGDRFCFDGRKWLTVDAVSLVGCLSKMLSPSLT